MNIELFQKILNESKCIKIGDCRDVGISGNVPWEDATEMAQDLGYYATFDGFEDPNDSNYHEITAKEFSDNCDYTLPKNHFLFLKSNNDELYIAYDKDMDIHHIYA